MRLAELQARLSSMEELRDIVGAMRSLASMRMAEAHRARADVRAYAAALREGIATAASLLPPPHPAGPHATGRTALVLCTAEHGFVGGFNERLLDAALPLCKPGDALFILGARGAARAAERGTHPAWSHAMATRLDGVPELVRRLAEELYRRLANASVQRIELLHADGTATPRHTTIFPLDLPAGPHPTSLPPLHNLTPTELLQRLAATYMEAQLTEAAVDSLAAENAARFTAMQAAHDNVSRKRDKLQMQARQLRQDEITTELLDLVTGAAATLGG